MTPQLSIPTIWEILMIWKRQYMAWRIWLTTSALSAPFPDPLEESIPLYLDVVSAQTTRHAIHICGVWWDKRHKRCIDMVFDRSFNSTTIQYNFVFIVGTTRCGSVNDNKAVVDERLRVINVTGVRVVDSGIMPQVVNSNHFAATAMIAEYGSQMIRDDNRFWMKLSSEMTFIYWY